jgi:flagellar hook-associated protein 1
MSGLTIALEVAKSTLLNTQVQIGTASHNIANADNKAYARQKVLLTTNLPYGVQGGFLGMGARIEGIVQQRDQFIERSLMGSISKQSDYETRASRLATAGAKLLDDGDQGISSDLGAFWDSWEALSQNPSGLSEKTQVTQATKHLASAIREASANLADTAADLETEAKSEVSAINSLLSEIASYNEEILKSEIGGDAANDLRDSRYQALTKLAESLPISYQEETDGTLTITLEDYSSDITLVSSNQVGALTYDSTNHRVTYSDSQGTVHPTPPDPVPPEENQLSSGRLNGILTVYKSIGTSHDLAYVLANPNASDLTYVDRLNAFASTLMTEVNSVHGSPVFSGTDASDIDIDSALSIDADQALSISELQDTRFPALGDSQLSGYLSDIQQRFGMDQEDALSSGAFQETLRQQLEAQQQSVSGVSIDEEMVDLLKFQQVYQAAAKIIQHTSDMMDAIINMV